MMKLDIAAPDPFLVERYLEEIARAYDIKWRSHVIQHDEEEEEEVEEDDDDRDGGQAEVFIAYSKGKKKIKPAPQS